MKFKEQDLVIAYPGSKEFKGRIIQIRNDSVGDYYVVQNCAKRNLFYTFYTEAYLQLDNPKPIILK